MHPLAKIFLEEFDFDAPYIEHGVVIHEEDYPTFYIKLHTWRFFKKVVYMCNNDCYDKYNWNVIHHEHWVPPKRDILENKTKFDIFLDGYEKNKILYKDIKKIIEQYVSELIFSSKNFNVIAHLNDFRFNKYKIYRGLGIYIIDIPCKRYINVSGTRSPSVRLCICIDCFNFTNPFDVYGSEISRKKLKGCMCTCE